MEEDKDIYIIPQNYDTPGKFLGIFDYTSLFIIAGWAGFLLGIIHLIPAGLTIKVYIFMFLFIPFAIFTLVGINNDPIISFFIYVQKFLKNSRIYLYSKVPH